MKPSTGKRARQKDSKICTPVVFVSWVLILGWLGFLWYCWKSGLLLSKKIPTMAEVDGFINHTEQVLLNKISHMHIGVKAPQYPVKFTDESAAQAETTSTEETIEVPDKAAAAPAPMEDEVHVIFSTDCTPFQDWQTLTVFHSAMVVGQKGTITRIASGCDEEKKVKLSALYKTLYPQYHVHFTPDYKKDGKTKKSYDFYNKPYGLQHWLDNADPPIRSGVVIALIDPDMIFLRPITTKVAGEQNLIYSSGIKPEEIFEKIGPGKPVSQQYGLGAPWARDGHPRFNRAKICGEGSPCLKPNENFAANHYSVGPPYIVEKDDLVRIAKSWTTFVPQVYEGYPFLLAEMYAYSMASAHEDLPHLQLDHYMVSNTDAGGEGWQWVDKLDDVCTPPVDGVYFPGQPLPTLVHFCQFFRVGDLGFQKRRLAADAFSCEAPMLVEPPKDLGFLDYKVTDQNTQAKIGKLQGRRNAFMICVLHRSINAAITDYKQRMCRDNANTNYSKTVNLRIHW
eukprot:gene783-1510_t